ncbi:hypothetical protein [Bacillus suaedaesalsae]|uniref:Uncharacterized protein n=1 Tax=Bacillus suaedaesalsae TaxID=2810349 RepID=A0ABS2DKS8_9BACI|nr:hypothetical protein [Bacillus suaedaesalsae]MBM6619099.1 hypothetical protein [Bacillus suaedaesalsae]
MTVKLNKIMLSYSFFLAILPILHLYKSGISVITLGEIGLILFSIITIGIILLKRQIVIFGKANINMWPFIFFIIILLLTCISLLFIGKDQISLIDIFNRFARLALWAFAISFMGYFLFEYQHTKKWVIRISVIATIYVLLQYFFWQIFNFHLPSVINNALIQPASEGYANTVRLTEYYTTRYIRPPSFFGEPAYYSYYTLVGLVLSLFSNISRGEIIKYVIPILLSIGIIISTSTSGIYLLLLVWLFYFFKVSKEKSGFKKSFLLAPITSLLILIVFAIYLKTRKNDFFLKIGDILSKPFEFEETSRLGGSYDLFNYLDGIHRFLGTGFGNENIFLHLDSVYYNSITVILLSSGYLGFITFCAFAGNLLRKKGSINFLLALIYILLCFSSSILYSSFSVIYLTIIFYINRFEAKQLHK